MKYQTIALPLALLPAAAFYFNKKLEQEKDNRVNDPNYYKIMSPLLFRHQDHDNRFTCGTMMNFHPEANGGQYMIFHSLENLKITLPDRIQDKSLRERKDHLQLDSSYSDSLIIEKPKAESYSSDTLPSIQESQ